MSQQWEKLNKNTWRLQVDGGYIYRSWRYGFWGNVKDVMDTFVPDSLEALLKTFPPEKEKIVRDALYGKNPIVNGGALPTPLALAPESAKVLPFVPQPPAPEGQIDAPKP